MNQYQKDALRTAPISLQQRYDIAHRMDTDREQDLIHASLGMLTEAGEFADHLKKYLFYGREMDILDMAAELGDVLWYIALAASTLGADLDGIMWRNIKKLKTRYPERFTEDNAISRDLEAEKKALE